VTDFDAVVVGGGPIGAVAALGLQAQALRVALIEHRVPTWEGNALGADARTLALSPASRVLLEAYSAWPEAAVGQFGAMEVSEERGTAVLRLAASDADSTVLGYIAEVSPWRVQLWRQLAAAGVVLFADSSLESVSARAATQATGGFDLKTQTQEISTRLLIAADGANSLVRSALGIAMHLTATGQCAVATAARVERGHEQTAYQRFLSGGPIALLPLSDEHLVSVVWSCTESHAHAVGKLSEDRLAVAIERASASRLGAVKAVLRPAVLPLRQGVIENFCPQPGVIFVGDAARVIHPLAGQGVNLGFEDVSALLACLASDGNWRRFARTRRARSQMVVRTMSLLNSAYAIQTPGVGWARNAVIRTLTGSAFLKGRLIQEAMGLGGHARAAAR